jgi:hypothetical protein
MKIIPDKRLFWFLRDDIELDLDKQAILDMYVQQVITHGNSKDIKTLFEKIGATKFKESFKRLKLFLPKEVRHFWEVYFGDA